jgi:hypothetical protein
MAAVVDTLRVTPIAVDESRARRVLDLLAPALVYLLVRLVGVGVLAAMAAANGSTLLDRLTAWDGDWLLTIAERGYSGVPDYMVDAYGAYKPFNALGFFPGYPGVVAAVGVLTGGNVVVAGLFVTWVSGIVAAYGLTRLGELIPGGSRRVGLLLTAVFAASPMSVALSMTYTEALFCALAVWALVGVLREQWLLAGMCAAAAGLVRPTGSSLAAAVGLAAAVAVLRRPTGWRPWVGGALAPAGFLGYLCYVSVQTGVLNGWASIQRDGWNWYIDGGAATVRFAADVLTSSNDVFLLLTVLALPASILLFGLAVRMRMPWPLLVYAGLVLFTAWGTDGLMSARVRVLLPAFVLLLPVAIGLARRRTATAVAVVAAAALGSAWFGAHALTIWPQSI